MPMLIEIASAVVPKPLMQNSAVRSNASFFIVVSSVLTLDNFEPALSNHGYASKMSDQDRFARRVDPFSVFANQIL